VGAVSKPDDGVVRLRDAPLITVNGLEVIGDAGVEATRSAAVRRTALSSRMRMPPDSARSRLRLRALFQGTVANAALQLTLDLALGK
jgi:hypothetical protein